MNVRKEKAIDFLQEQAMSMDWECADSDTQYLTHSIHRYSGKFIPQIASNAIELLTSKGDTILDVYAGSGTTLLEAAIANRRSIGVDLSPLAVLISKVKTTPIYSEDLNIWYKNFCATISLYSKDINQESLFPPVGNTLPCEFKNDPRLVDGWYLKWFQLPVLKELLWIDQNISLIKDENIQNIALVALSDILRKCSNAHSGYPNVMFDKNKGSQYSAIPKFIRRLHEIIQSVKMLGEKIPEDCKPMVLECSNISMPIEAESIDCIITHPPYIGSVPYAEYGLLSLTWLGHNPKDLDLKLTGGKRQSKDVVTRFQNDYGRMFFEAHRVLKPNKYFFILVGNPTVKGEIVDLSEMSDTSANLYGFEKVLHLTRSGVNRRANKMGEEHILIYKKRKNL